jgi:hypothetical protein
MGMIQSAIVLLYVCGRFGHDLAGIPGTVAILGIFAGAEIYLVVITRKPAVNPAREAAP